MTSSDPSEQILAWLMPLLELSHDAVIGLNADGAIVSWNSGAEQLYGYRGAEVAGRPLASLAPARLHAEEAERLAAIGAATEAERYETRRVTQDGQERVVAVKIARLPDTLANGAAFLSVEREVPRAEARRGEAAGPLAEAPDARPGESPNAVIRDLESTLRDIAGARHAFALDLDVLGFFGAVDPKVMERIVVALTRRAAEALEHGTIRVSSRRCSLEDDDRDRPAGLAAGDYLRVDVRGIGTLRAGADTAGRRFSGAEVDVALTELAAARLNGFLTSRRAAGEVCWSLYLPAILSAAPEAADTAAASEPASRGTVLVVDDEPPVRDVIARALAAHGYTVLRACNGEDALEVAGRHAAPIHLVVSDIVMPEMDGARLFDHLRAWYPNLRFVLISGYTRGALEAEHLKDGITRFLPKPFALDELVSAVDEMLESAA